MFKEMLMIASLSVMSSHGMDSSDIRVASSLQTTGQDNLMFEAQAVVQEVNPSTQTILAAIHQTLLGISLQLEENNKEIKELGEELKEIKLYNKYNKNNHSGSLKSEIERNLGVYEACRQRGENVFMFKEFIEEERQDLEFLCNRDLQNYKQNNKGFSGDNQQKFKN